MILKKYNEIMAMPLKEEKYLVDKLILENTIGMICAPPKKLKSIFTQELAIACSSDKEGLFLGKFKTRPCKVIIIDKENTFNKIHKRLDKLTRTDEVKDLNLWVIKNSSDHNLLFYNKESANQDNETTYLIKQLKPIKPDILILDSLIRFHTSEENSSTEMSKVYNVLDRIRTELNCTIICIHHTNKLGKSRGSSDLQAMVDWQYRIDTNNKKKYILTVEECRDKQELDGFEFLFWEDETTNKLHLQFEKYITSQDDYKGGPRIYMKDEAKKNILDYIENYSITEFETKDIKTWYPKMKGNAKSDALKELVEKDEFLAKTGQGKYIVI